jgi:ATP-dependent DNA helicase RecG
MNDRDGGHYWACMSTGAIEIEQRPTMSSPGSSPGPRAFASAEPLSQAQLLSAPVRWPRPSRLKAPLEVPSGKMADGLAALGLTSVGALLEHLPRDSRDARTIGALRPGESATVAVQVRTIAARPVRRRGMKPLVEASVFDETGRVRATFFNQPWLVQRYKPGTRLVLHGKLGERGTFNVAHHAIGTDIGADQSQLRGEDGGGNSGSGNSGGGNNSSGGNNNNRNDGDGNSGGDINSLAVQAGREEGAKREVQPAGEGEGEVAHYPAADGISSTQILALVQSYGHAFADVPETLDASLRTRERLPDRASALAAMHRAQNSEERETARARLAFDELLLAQLVFLRRRQARRARSGAPELSAEPSLSRRWLQTELPFELTGDQRRAIAEIGEDLEQTSAMQRLLLGEVGSGKTVVALWAMLRAVEHGMQAALMAPTETLAEQHFATLQQLLGAEQANVTCALLTGSTSARRRADTLGKLASGELQMIVGTHALIEPDVQPRALAVAVVDEQHRFGVRQRAALDRKGADGVAPHVLHMTATPIPRTLALANYGDLDTTMLRELPGGRQPIQTRIVSGESERARAYEELRAQLSAGRQAYVVCPLIEHPDADADATQPTDATQPAGVNRTGAAVRPGGDGNQPAEASEMRAATAELERLQKEELRDYRLVLLHGGMRPGEKAHAMAQFAAGLADVLVATTVIEVGIDVSNATVIVVENAERFGISQLHQLRGRVGRGEHPSKCLLMGAANIARLRALAEHSDGFALAEIDLRLRNEGELIGTRQSGIGQHRIASLPEDAQLLERARARAEGIVAADPGLRSAEHALLADALAHAFGDETYEPIPG